MKRSASVDFAMVDVRDDGEIADARLRHAGEKRAILAQLGDRLRREAVLHGEIPKTRTGTSRPYFRRKSGSVSTSISS